MSDSSNTTVTVDGDRLELTDEEAAELREYSRYRDYTKIDPEKYTK